ncbi:MAG: preprotein translocase subunit SecE [Thaumarchaeota archaeon]|jgi:preprotein translocase subunit SecE|nr:MAG: preprotein translocase subunit SecE [Nitrososphaerota archaeon]|tara:strand:+ start:350 stop:541 length:192 start_codon:yes stop_codon:yes gene_type:complete
MFEKIGQYFSSVQTELKKVTWLSKDELLGSTVIVGIFSLIVSIFLFVIDFGLTEFVSRLLGGK